MGLEQLQGRADGTGGVIEVPTGIEVTGGSSVFAPWKHSEA